MLRVAIICYLKRLVSNKSVRHKPRGRKAWLARFPVSALLGVTKAPGGLSGDSCSDEAGKEADTETNGDSVDCPRQDLG